MDIQEQIFFESMQFSYIIRKPKSKSLRPQSVYILFRIGKKQYKINTGAKVLSKNWHNGRLTACNLIDVKNNDILLSFLNKNNSLFLNLKQYLCNHEELSNMDAIVSMFFNKYKEKEKIMPKAKKKKKEIYLSEILYQSIRNGVKETTQKTYNHYVDTLIQFMDENNIDDVASNGTKDTLIKYQQYLLSKGNKVTGINNRITVFSKLLRQAAKDEKYDYTFDRSIEDIDKLKEAEHRENLVETYFTLTEKEINQIYYYNGTDAKPLTLKQQYVKDCFVLECLTGQRVGDCQRLLSSKDLPIIESEGLKFISYRDTKTRSQCLIPIDNPIVKEILEKYKNSDIKVSQCHINYIVKALCKSINIDREVNVIKGDELIKVPLYSAIHTHVGRHTFITQMYLKGLNKEQIIRITGHKDTKMIDTIYLNLNKQDKADMLAKSINSMNGKGNDDKHDDDKHDENDNKPNIPTPTNNTNQSNDAITNNSVDSIIQLAKENIELKQELDKVRQQVQQPELSTQDIQPIQSTQYIRKDEKNETANNKVIKIGIALMLGTLLCLITHQQQSITIATLSILFSISMISIPNWCKEYIIKYI